MKCQKCGKNETNFHYSSNINGSVTEAHLCAQCAAEAGYDVESMFNTDNFFRVSFPLQGRQRGFLPLPIFGFEPMFGYMQLPHMRLQSNECARENTCETPVQEDSSAQVDTEMQKRREINVLREQMRFAADNDDFEKAALLRDQIRQMEAE